MSIKRFIPPRYWFGVQALVAFVLLLVLASCSKDETFNTGERVILPEGCKKIDVDFLAPWLADNKLAKKVYKYRKEESLPEETKFEVIPKIGEGYF